ncbi:MAG: spore coat protein U domain-containing protein [Bacteriovorax sp.]|jgi:spore coat protein U-like protein
MKYYLSLLVIFSSANALGASCDFLLSMNSISYTVIATNPSISQNFTLYRDKGGSSCGNFVIGFSKGASATYNRIATNSANGTTIPYNLYKTSAATTALRRLTDASSTNQVVTGTISKNQTKTLNYFFQLGTLSTTTMTRAGTYTDTVNAEASEGTFSDGESPEETKPVSITIVVPKSIAISLVDTGAVHNSSATSKILDFGELTESEELGFDVKIASNAGYTLSVSSTYNQTLRLEDLPAAANTQIDYDFYASNTQRNLSSSSSSPVMIGSGSGSTPILGTSVPVRIVIKSVDNKISGTYKDYVTFTVATTE